MRFGAGFYHVPSADSIARVRLYPERVWGIIRRVLVTNNWTNRVDEHLQQLVQQLAEAINDAINDSDDVNEALAELRAAGYPALLVVEATIAFKDEAEQPEATAPVTEMSAEERFEKLSKEDRQFLRSLNIKFDSDE